MEEKYNKILIAGIVIAILYIIYIALKKMYEFGNSNTEKKGTVDARGTSLQSGLSGGVLKTIGLTPNWLGIPPSGAAGMRFYGHDYSLDNPEVNKSLPLNIIDAGHEGGAGTR